MIRSLKKLSEAYHAFQVLQVLLLVQCLDQLLHWLLLEYQFGGLAGKIGTTREALKVRFAYILCSQMNTSWHPRKTSLIFFLFSKAKYNLQLITCCIMIFALAISILIFERVMYYKLIICFAVTYFVASQLLLKDLA